MRIFQGLFTGFMGLAVLLTGCGDGDSDSNFSLSSSEPLVNVALQDNKIIIDILDNDLQIQDIVVNRGNCWVVDAFYDTIEYTGKFSNNYGIYEVEIPTIFYSKAGEFYLEKVRDDIYSTRVGCSLFYGSGDFYKWVNKKEGSQACRGVKWDKFLEEHDNDYPSAYLAYAESIQKEYLNQSTFDAQEYLAKNPDLKEYAPEDFMKTIKEALKEFQEAEMFFMDEIKKRKPTKKYQFGDKTRTLVYSTNSGRCNVREAVIKTNKGNWSFGWEQH
ncbi:hypothetical protein LS68_005055 [Helicobacter sp. MIT 05-5293]|uniref:hypothetical protein n=1 Tax=Helicobacter sp. MIT 05-5293 TaxID=1548149 RepID=UPI00051D4CB2|nr:hypothetical protein [Helicobacter sp. MIT 05-5293]TLD80848.1 hypothetical protein LS68_005055 [Helicobacter sp. MIT 05-5293]